MDHKNEKLAQMFYSDFLLAKPLAFDFFEDNFGDKWSYTEAIKCDNCGEITIAVDDFESGNFDCVECGLSLWSSGPLMNYLYPIDLRQVGDMESAAIALEGLPLVIVEFSDEQPVPYGLALTGGGMDLSWEIAEAYIRLGYMPPVHFARLPQLAGKKLNSTTILILTLMRKGIGMLIDRRQYELTALDRLEAAMATNPVTLHPPMKESANE